MSSRAFFGPPGSGPVKGGLQVSVHIVPVHEGRLVAFDVKAGDVHGRWLPWAVIDYRQNPYEAAALLADDWLDVPLSDLRIVDVMSLDGPLGGWELAIVCRADMTSLPRGDESRRPFVYAPGEFDAIGVFDPVDLERWVGMGATAAAREPSAPPGPVQIF
jgi:hypothetical protein